MEGLNPNAERKLWENIHGADSPEIRDLEYIAQNLPENLQIYKETVFNLEQKIRQGGNTEFVAIALKKLDELLTKYQKAEETLVQNFKNFIKEKTEESLQATENGAQSALDHINQLSQDVQTRIQEIYAQYNSREKFDEFKKTKRNFVYYLKQFWRLVGPISSARAMLLDRQDEDKLFEEFQSLRQQAIDKALIEWETKGGKTNTDFSRNSLVNPIEIKVIIEKHKEQIETIKNFRASFSKDLKLLEKQLFSSGENN